MKRFKKAVKNNSEVPTFTSPMISQPVKKLKDTNGREIFFLKTAAPPLPPTPLKSALRAQKSWVRGFLRSSSVYVVRAGERRLPYGEIGIHAG